MTLNLAIMIPFLVAAIIPFIYKKLTRIHIGWFVFAVSLLLFIYLIRYVPSIANGETYINIVEWIPSIGINFTTYLDGLSMIFGLLITGIGALVILYSIYYFDLDEDLHSFYMYLLIFMGGMLGVVFSDNLMVLYLFWELTSISSFLLIAFWFHRKQSRYGAQKSFLITVGGGIAMLVGFIMLYVMTGTFSIQEILPLVSELPAHELFIPAMILILLGAFTKSAQFPFHIWLPDAMEAPTPVSAYLHSATMVKAGIYLVARFTPIFGGGEIWFWLVTGVGMVTMIWGSFNAIRQTDLKALLAYSTISQLGLIMSLFGMGSAALYYGYSADSVFYTQATFAALFHLVNHSTFKGALFMVIGIIDHEVGTRDIRKLGGLMAFMPVTFTIALIGSFSMAGLPLFNGFLSKEMFFTAVINISQLDIFSLNSLGVLFPVVAWIASVFTFIYSLIIVFKTFFGPYQEEKLEHEAAEPPIGMMISPGILAVLVVLIFFFPNVIGYYLLNPAMGSVYPGFGTTVDLGQNITAWHGFNTELWMTIGVVITGVILYLLLRYWKGIFKLFPDKWTFNTLYDYSLTQIESSSTAITKTYMTGVLRDYFLYIYIFFVGIIGITLFYTGAFSFDMSNDVPISIYEWIMVVVMMVAGIAILFAKSRLTAIVLNGVLGYSISVLFVLFRAPDLALTQIVVETITTVLFLLCFYFLPEWKKESNGVKTKTVNLLISISVGLTFVLVALSVQHNKLFETISGFFEDAYELAGGRNIVNAILGDFRALDTMLEVVVLLIAGIGVYSLIKLKAKKGGPNSEN
ncbi:multicomponent Na+:H+ antiporter subunit A [Virgibacillus natechei]|uniref:Multicomponent Na+:H+ antiporter subunit A n=1 Tax=Virgibacillus natechei TaxID=1216297 RepID=A0ABS4IK17_9BACI|nr:multicomponent Na+:H+ antiporter subunit A [Virgibacillus natechei]